MGLKNFKLPTADIALPGGEGKSFSVRGLSLDDIAYLIRNHKAKLGELFDEFQTLEGGDGVNLDAPESLVRMMLPLMEAVPRLMADIIACASGDAGNWKIATQLPFPLQVEAIEKTLLMTFSAEGGLKKVLETVIRLAQGTTALVKDLGISETLEV